MDIHRQWDFFFRPKKNEILQKMNGTGKYYIKWSYSGSQWKHHILPPHMRILAFNFIIKIWAVYGTESLCI